MKAKTIAYITETAVNDRHAWSGTAHYVFTALEKEGYKVIPLGPARPFLTRVILAGFNQISLKLFKKRFDYRHSSIYSKAFGRLFDRKLKALEVDLVVVCGATEYGAYLTTSKPIYYVLDRTIGGAIGYHNILKNLWSFSEKQSIATDRLAMQKAKALLFSSEWAAAHAKTIYHTDQKKCFVVPFGANIDILPSREQALQAKNQKPWRLLMLATAWKNKGADIAINAVNILHKKGLPVHLTIVGSTPEEKLEHNFLTIIPFLDKNTQEGKQKIDELYYNSHLFILPTRFDCTPIVFCEASAYGVPVISANTGGVAGHIKEGQNGFLIDYADNGEQYASLIEKIMSNADEYEALRIRARNYFEQYLNWTAWAKAFRNLEEQL